GEARAAAGRSDIDAAAFARHLARSHGLTCVVTLGAAGALALGPEGGQRIAALPVDPVDTTGAGDAFVGVLAAALDLGDDLGTALRRASVAAGLACTRLGAQTSQPTAAEIEARLADLPPAAPLG
ncbi:MAG TPA: PfkB family carbohydrate kinase, partial [Geminicoccaceae bacterium]|nr:PfkB family carbohydrate kinase [Geminicoccaceae bacterium]